jgi:hypothetical protein
VLAVAERRERYRVELVAHVDNVHDHDPYQPVPYSGYRSGEESCGANLDLVEGSTVYLTAGAKMEPDGPKKCTGGCYNRRATAEVDGVSVSGAASSFPRSVGSDAFFARFVATIENCEVTYDIGIAAVEQRFMTTLTSQ